MKGKFMIIAALLGALTFGACVDSEESASVTAVRNAKAEQLKSIATLNNAKAQAEATIAAAEAQLAAAQAQLLAAEAAALNAATEEQKIANQIAAAEAAQKIAEIEAAMALAEIQYQMDLAKAALEFNKNTESLFVELNNEYIDALDAQYTATVNLAEAEATLAAAEEGLASVEEIYEEVIAYYESELAKKESSLASKNDELALVKKVSVYDMTWDDLVKANANAAETNKAAILKGETEAKNFAAASTTWSNYQNSVNNTAYMKAYAGSGSVKGWGALYAADVNNVLPTQVTFAYDHDNNPNTDTKMYFGFYGGNWNTTTKAWADDTKGIALWSPSPAETKADKYDFNGVKKGKSGYKGDTYAYNPRTAYFNIVSENVEAYAAIALQKLEYKHADNLAAKANEVAMAKSAFENVSNGVSDKIMMDKYLADYNTVVNKIAAYETSLEAAQHTIAAYQSFITKFGVTATSTILDATAFAALGAANYGYTYATYSSYFTIAVNALKAEAEATKWLNTGISSTVAAEKAFLASLSSGVVTTTAAGVTTTTYAYDNMSLNTIKSTIVSKFSDFEEGIYIETKGYFAALEAQANAQEAYEADQALVEKAVAILETMAAEAENWTETAITGYNTANAAYLKALYNKDQAAANVTATSDKLAAIADFIAAVCADSATDAQKLEVICAEKIKALNADIAKLEKEIEDLEDDIEELTLEALTAEAEDAVIVAQVAVAKAEAALAIAEANLAAAKAALDAVLAE